MEKFKKMESDRQFNMEFKKTALQELLDNLEKRYPDVKLMPGIITEDGQGGFLKDGKPIDYEGIRKFILSLRKLDESDEKDKWYDK
jgi:hypothetical protein